MSRSGMTFFSGILVLAASITIRAKVSQDDRAGEGPGTSCAKSVLLNFVVNRYSEPVREVPIWQLPDKSAFFFSSGMTIDADGAPNAYNPENTGLDDLANAGTPGHWDGIVQNQNGDLGRARCRRPLSWLLRLLYIACGLGPRRASIPDGMWTPPGFPTWCCRVTSRDKPGHDSAISPWWSTCATTRGLLRSLQMSAHWERVRLPWPTIWGFGPTPAAGGVAGGSSISCSRGREMDSRGLSKKSTLKPRSYSRIGEVLSS